MIPLRPIAAILLTGLAVGCSSPATNTAATPVLSTQPVVEVPVEPPPPEEPPTLDAARQSAQARWDRIGAGDYQSTYDMFTTADKAAFPEKDYVGFELACDKRMKKTGGLRDDQIHARVTVTDPRWVGTTKTRAAVTVANLTNLMEAPATFLMVYEAGRWTSTASNGLRGYMARVAKDGLKKAVEKECTLN